MIKYLSFKRVTQDSNGVSGVSGYYFDYLISEKSLTDYLGIRSGDVTPFGWFQNKEEQAKALKELSLKVKPRLPNGRIELYICAACGDIGCGSLTAKIIDKGDRIIWSQFATQSDPDELSEIYEVDEIEFDRLQYFKALTQIR